MITICVDPGVRHCGAAVFRETNLIHAGLPRSRMTSGRGPPAHVAMAGAVVRWWLDFALAAGVGMKPDNLLVEFPIIYPKKQEEDLNDLLDLAGVVGAIAALLAPTHEFTAYFPSQWKGSVKKPIMTARIRNALTSTEQANITTAGAKDHNTLDAVGIGLYRFGRIHQKVIIR